MTSLDKVESAIQKDLCDHCLGRLFAQLGTGMTNRERGEALRKLYAMFISEEERTEVPEEAESCGLCFDLFEETDKFAELASERLEEYEFEDFLIGSRIDPEIEENEESLWTELNLSSGEPIKSEVNREVGKRVQRILEKEVEIERPDIKAIIDTRFDSVEIEVSPLFIYGRYQKLSRDIPQTRWICKRCRGKGCEKCGGTGKMYETSVEEIIGEPLIEMTSGEDFTLHGMGREDIDAKMLGNGRPFVIEVKEPVERNIYLNELEREINESDKVKVNSLNFTQKEKVVELKQARSVKTYRIEISTGKQVDRGKFKKVKNELVEREISQKTPKRVSHRRADKVRKRKIRGLELISVDEKTMVLEITCDAGTYVKEFVHGDEGRTEPNLADLLETECEVEKLDVIKIHYSEGEENEEI